MRLRVRGLKFRVDDDGNLKVEVCDLPTGQAGATDVKLKIYSWVQKNLKRAIDIFTGCTLERYYKNRIRG